MPTAIQSTIVVALLLVAAVARADDPDVSHDGEWSAVIRTEANPRQSAHVTIRNFGGTWTRAVGREAMAGKACVGKKLPITLQASTADALEFTVWGSSVSPDCVDLTVVTKPVGENAFEGQVESVGTIRLTRR